MTIYADNLNPLDADPPRKPNLDDFNGANKFDDAEFPPDPTTMPTSAEYNTLCRLAVTNSRMSPVLVVAVRWVSTVPTIDYVLAANSQTLASHLTVTTAGVGDVTIDWPTTGTGALPVTLMPALATVTEDAVASIRTLRPNEHSVRVKASSSVSFVVVVY